MLLPATLKGMNSLALANNLVAAVSHGKAWRAGVVVVWLISVAPRFGKSTVRNGPRISFFNTQQATMKSVWMTQ